MTGRGRWVAAAAGVVLLAVLLTCYPTRTRQVKRKLSALASWVAKDGPEGNLAMASGASKAGEFFAPRVRVESEAHDFSGEVSREDIQRWYVAGRARFATLRPKFYDAVVEFPAPDRAEVRATLRLSGTTDGGDAVNETHEVTLSLTEGDAGWRVGRVALVQVLKR